MTDILKKHQAEISKLCQKYHVLKLEVFGSATDPEHFDQRCSDLDFLVEFQALEPGQNAGFYFGLLEDLRDIFKRDIDLVMLKAIKNRYFLESIKQHREVIYAA